MKNPTPQKYSCAWKLLAALSFAAIASSSALADVVYVTSMIQGCTATSVCGAVQTDGTYVETGITLGVTGIKGGAPGRPVTPTASRAYLSGTVFTSTDGGCDIRPTLAVPGAVYQIDYNWNATAANSSTNVVLSVSSTDGVLSTNSTPLMQRSFADVTAEANSWLFMGYITNNPGVTQPLISFRYQSGTVQATGGNRLLFDCWRFTLAQPCLSVAPVNVTGPLATNLNQVVVSGVSGSATAVTVYQDSGAGFVQVGTKTTGVVAGNNTVTVSGLVKGAKVGATQTISSQEGCTPTDGPIVGGGANPRVRVVFSIRETSSTGPVGSAGDSTSVNIHFLGASGVLSGSPTNGPVPNPSTSWQTVSISHAPEGVLDSANVVGAAANGPGYAASDAVDLQVYPYKTFHGVTIYSTNAAQSVSSVTSNDVFSVNWTWSAVAGADGYRILHQVNNAGFGEYLDVPSNSYTDTNAGWLAGPDVSTITTPHDASIQWNPTANTSPDVIGTPWGILESINFAIDDLTDTGPYDLYIDNVANGNTVFQDFEGAVAGATGVGFRQPSFSGTTGGNILDLPNESTVSNGAADTGTKSLRIRFQWNGTNSTKWLRLTTSGAGNPQVFLGDPVSIRILLLPVNAVPVAPPPPTLSVSQSGGNAVLDWTGAHNLQAAPIVTGPYTNIPGVTTGPYTDIDTATTLQRFFRLRN
jgi:hypothetical protein